MKNIKITMGVKVIIFCLFSLPLILLYPFIYVIEFSILGYTGEEEFVVTKNWGLQTILPREKVGRNWKNFRLISFSPIRNLQIQYPNLNTPPRMMTIQSGVVRVHQENMIGKIFYRCDWLNIKSEYLDITGARMFKDKDIAMANVRSGYSGWTGYYHMVGC